MKKVEDIILGVIGGAIGGYLASSAVSARAETKKYTMPYEFVMYKSGDKVVGEKYDGTRISESDYANEVLQDIINSLEKPWETAEPVGLIYIRNGRYIFGDLVSVPDTVGAIALVGEHNHYTRFERQVDKPVISMNGQSHGLRIENILFTQPSDLTTSTSMIIGTVEWAHILNNKFIYGNSIELDSGAHSIIAFNQFERVNNGIKIIPLNYDSTNIRIIGNIMSLITGKGISLNKNTSTNNIHKYQSIIGNIIQGTGTGSIGVYSDGAERLVIVSNILYELEYAVYFEDYSVNDFIILGNKLKYTTIKKGGGNKGIILYNRDYITENIKVASVTLDGTTTDYLLTTHDLSILSSDRTMYEVECTPASQASINVSPIQCYVSDEDGDGKYESIRVKLNNPGTSGLSAVFVVKVRVRTY